LSVCRLCRADRSFYQRRKSRSIDPLEFACSRL
jgi:hypothetical protein